MKKMTMLGFFFASSLSFPACATNAHQMSKNIVEGNSAALRGDFETSVSSYETALAHVPESAPAKRNLGIVLVRVGNYERARKVLQEAVRMYPADLEVFYFLGEANRGIENYKEAIQAYQKALSLETGDLRTQKALAWTFIKIGEYDKALFLAQPQLAKSPNDTQLRLILATVYNRKKMYAEAQLTLKPVESSGFTIANAEKTSADSEKVLLMTALADAEYGLTNFSKAALLYAEVVKMRPFYADALIGSAKCDIRSSQSPRAIIKLERTLKTDKNNPEALYLLAKLSEKVDERKAISFYKSFLKAAKGRSELKEAVKRSRKAVAKLNSASLE